MKMNETLAAAPAAASVKQPGVSVCIPTYNGSKHLAECINSILAQTCRDFEVVICDDQSSDGTLDLARELAKGDERFRFISNPRRFGLVGNWNNCIKQARGEWIKFVFQDDILMPACLETLLGACQRENKPFGFCERDIIFEEGTADKLREWFAGHQRRLRSDYQAGPVITREQVAGMVGREMFHNPVGEPTLTLIKKTLFDELGGFDEALIQLCDAEFWYRVMIHHGAVFVGQSLAAFRVHAQATTSRNHKQRQFRIYFLDPLVMRYQFAFGRHFEPLRNPKLTGRSTISVWKECAIYASQARLEARKNAQSGDDFLLKEWTSVVAHYPRLETAANIGRVLHFLMRIKAGIKRRVRRILVPG